MKNKQKEPTPTFLPPHSETGKPARKAAHERITPGYRNRLPEEDTSHPQGGKGQPSHAGLPRDTSDTCFMVRGVSWQPPSDLLSFHEPTDPRQTN